MTDLFSYKSGQKPQEKSFAPLAERVRPQHIRDFVGHEDIVGRGTILFEEIKNSRIKSMIFWGPPGVGKTTLARIIANEVDSAFRPISAVTAGVKDVRKIIEEARQLRKYQDKSTILFIDEIHRFNKAQQDALLHAVESGIIILIGATTENPSFEVISPLLSRSQVYQMQPLNNENIRKIVERALHSDERLNQQKIEVDDWDSLLKLANGDARRALNIIEKSLELIKDKKPPLHLTAGLFEKAALRKTPRYDKSGEYHYDLISAFIKSLRGSDPDAAIYWMARMLESGEDPKFVARRMLILAAEDVGNADPDALTLATSCFSAVNFVGMPEAKIILSQTAAYLASAPKSNAAVEAINRAIQDAQEQPDLPVPLQLRNAPTSLLAGLGYGKDYNYAHNFENHFVEETYLPPELKDRIYYQPSDQGKEIEILNRLKKLWKNLKNYTAQSPDKQNE
jgi:putative ATPase